MAKNTISESRRIRGGWLHPLAFVLLVGAIAWAVGSFFTTSDKRFFDVGAIPGVYGLGAWNWAIAAVLLVIAYVVADRTRPLPEPGTTSLGNRWALPAMLTCASIGLLWIVVFYTTAGTDVVIPFYTDLGNWNIVIGMGFIVAAFGFSMKWE